MLGLFLVLFKIFSKDDVVGGWLFIFLCLVLIFILYCD